MKGIKRQETLEINLLSSMAGLLSLLSTYLESPFFEVRRAQVSKQFMAMRRLEVAILLGFVPGVRGPTGACGTR